MLASLWEKVLKRPIWLLLGMLLVAAGFVVSLLPPEQWAQSVRLWIEGLGALSFIAFGLTYILAAVLLIPVWPLSITGGLAFGLWGFFLVPISATLGASAAFVISRYFARGKIREWLAQRPQYHAIEQAVSEEGWKVIILLRLSPLVPYNLMNYFCGMTGVSFAAYLVATFFGTIPVTALYVYLGFLGQSVATGSMGWPQWALLGLGLTATVAVTVLITRTVRPKLQAAGTPKHSGGEERAENV